LRIGFLEWFFLGMPVELFLVFVVLGAIGLVFAWLGSVGDRLRQRRGHDEGSG
jgi:hypothetical protein